MFVSDILLEFLFYLDYTVRIKGSIPRQERYFPDVSTYIQWCDTKISTLLNSHLATLFARRDVPSYRQMTTIRSDYVLLRDIHSVLIDIFPFMNRLQNPTIILDRYLDLLELCYDTKLGEAEEAIPAEEITPAEIELESEVVSAEPELESEVVSAEPELESEIVSAEPELESEVEDEVVPIDEDEIEPVYQEEVVILPDDVSLVSSEQPETIHGSDSESEASEDEEEELLPTGQQLGRERAHALGFRNAYIHQNYQDIHDFLISYDQGVIRYERLTRPALLKLFDNPPKGITSVPKLVGLLRERDLRRVSE